MDSPEPKRFFFVAYSHSPSLIPSHLVPDLPQKVLPPLDFDVVFDALGSEPVYHAEEATAQLCFGQDDFRWVAGGADDRKGTPSPLPNRLRNYKRSGRRQTAHHNGLPRTAEWSSRGKPPLDVPKNRKSQEGDDH